MRGAGTAETAPPRQRDVPASTDPTPENVLAGLEVQEKSLRELRRYLFTRLFQLQVRACPERPFPTAHSSIVPSIPSRLLADPSPIPPPPCHQRRRKKRCFGTSSRNTDARRRWTKTMPPIDETSKITYKRGKKKVAAKQPSPAQCLDWLACSNLHGVFSRNAVWLACTKQLAYFLERVCLGRRVTSPAAAEGVPVFFNRLGANAGTANESATPTLVRLSPEDTWVMAHHMDCLTVHSVESGVPPGETPTGETPGGDTTTGTPGETRSDTQTPEYAPAAHTNQTQTWLMRLTQRELWQTLVTLGADKHGVSNFVCRVAVHLHFRNQGWLPRSGLQYGADLVLYRNHPSLVHSDFCAVVTPSAAVSGASIAAVASFKNTGFTGSPEETTDRKRKTTTTSRDGLGLRRWTEVQAASRLCVQVNKGLVSVFVDFGGGGGFGTRDLSTPECLRHVLVTETEIKRFNPERNKP
jgi:tRNA-splicing endonuclease subunit Sen2